MSNITSTITCDAIQLLLVNLVLDRLTKSDTIVSAVAISIVGVARRIKEIVKICREDRHKFKGIEHKDRELNIQIILAKINKGLLLTDPKCGY